MASPWRRRYRVAHRIRAALSRMLILLAAAALAGNVTVSAASSPIYLLVDR